MNTQEDWEAWFSSTIELEEGNAAKAERRRQQLVTVREKYHQALRDGDDELARTLLAGVSGPGRYLNTPKLPNEARKDAASLLSSSGAALLAIAALVFTAVAWDSLGVIGQAAVLLMTTTASVFGAIFLSRRKRPATAESLSWLAGALAAIDVLAVSRLGLVDDIPTHLLFAAAAAGAGLIANVTSRLAGPDLRGPKQLLPISLALTSVFATWEFDNSLRAFLLAVVAFVCIRASTGSDTTQWGRSAAGLAAVAAFSVFAVDTGVVQLILGLGAGALLVGRAVNLNLTRMRISLTALAVVELGGLSILLVTAARETSSWSGATPAPLPLAAFVLLGIVSARWMASTAVAFVTPLVGALIGVHLSDTSVLSRLSVVTAVTVTALVWVSRSQLAARTVLSAAVPYLGGLVVAQIGGPTTAAFSVTTALTVVAVHLGIRKNLVDNQLQAITAAAGSVALAAVLLSVGERPQLAGVLTVLAVGSALLALQRRGRGAAVVVSAASAAGSYWSLLPEARVVELATLPVAFVWCLVGVVALRRSTLRSFPLLGPGLLLASVPSVIELVFTGETLVRTLLLVVVATAVALFGARHRLLTPILVGVFTALASAITQVGPWAIGLPRWLTLGCAGVALLLAGARFETLRERLNSTGTKLIALR